ncbi:antibiotic biosynthesis monooxygenase [Paenibacillus gorillae]|uniref:antibiotic biosynthesis monooxygenase n=1 Tax=Paenibacillus gorillae TaxID=1243662 RepID=UPI0004B0643D|nr:antibiotic biosynthesis monooxygenase [Paenibacillus gorillae]
MLIQTRTITVHPGNADKVVERFSQPGPLDGREGLIDRTIMVNKWNTEQEEIVVIIRWESEDAWKSWEKSPEHIQGHRDRRGETQPEYIIDTVVNMYEVKRHIQ